MKLWLAIIVTGILIVTGFAAPPGPQVLNVDHKISIHAESVTLGNLLRLWDEATGMRSRVPPGLANRRLSISFTGLSVEDALRKIFDGQPFGYYLVEGQLVVTEFSQSESIAEPESEPSEDNVPQVVAEPVLPEIERQKPQPLPPKMTLIPTPFGPIVSSTQSQLPFVQLPPVLAPPPPPFFLPTRPPTPPAGAANGPLENQLFGPLSIYQNPGPPAPSPLQR